MAKHVSYMRTPVNTYTGHTTKYMTLETKEAHKLHHFPVVVGICLLQILSPLRRKKKVKLFSH